MVLEGKATKRKMLLDRLMRGKEKLQLILILMGLKKREYALTSEKVDGSPIILGLSNVKRRENKRHERKAEGRRWEGREREIKTVVTNEFAEG